MSDLIAITFDSKDTAREALMRASKLEKQHLLDLEDAVIVSRDEDGRVHLQQSINTTAIGATHGGLWGTLLGLLFLNPLIGLAVGAASGALGGYLTDLGIDDSFMKDMGENLKPGGAALFVLVRKSTPDRVLPELRELGGTVLTTSLPLERERALREALEGEIRRRVAAGEPLLDSPLENARDTDRAAHTIAKG